MSNQELLVGEFKGFVDASFSDGYRRIPDINGIKHSIVGSYALGLARPSETPVQHYDFAYTGVTRLVAPKDRLIDIGGTSMTGWIAAHPNDQERLYRHWRFVHYKLKAINFVRPIAEREIIEGIVADLRQPGQVERAVWDAFALTPDERDGLEKYFGELDATVPDLRADGIRDTLESRRWTGSVPAIIEA